jgi:DEAD/DEAH box helicase domain protein
VTNLFSELGLPKAVVDAVTALGYTSPTPVQQQAIPALLSGRDVLAAAQTGTGKTAAFALPVISKMLAVPKARASKKVRALVLAPTRELAAQIDENIRAYCAQTELNTVLIFGGVNIRPQTEALLKGCDFLIATPGRLLDHAGQLNVDLSEVEFLILDEADRMLDMGFIHDIRRIVKLLPAKRQTLMFSATFSTEIRELADSYLNNPVSVEIAKNKESTLISQEAWSIAKKRKRELLRDLIVDNQWDQVLVFTRMKHTANRLASQLEKDGIVAAAIHGNKSQSARTKALAGFKDKTIRVLVATDIAARGLDIEGLPHVINYELPNVAEDYVHRIGRTGRAGVPGHAVSLVSDDEKDLLSAIEKLLKKRIDLKKAEGYEGEPPADIVADEKERDAARKRELEKLRESRRKQRKEKPAKTEVAKEVHEAVKLEAQSAGISDNPDERFEKKIRRKPQQKTVEAQQPQVTKNRRARREPNPIPRGNNGQIAQDTRRSNERNGAGKIRPARRGTPGTDRRSLRASWEPADPFAPENQAIFLPQTMPGNFRSHQRNKTRPDNRRDPEGNRFGQERRRSNASNIKSTVQRAPKTAYSDSRFESVSSNLPPGMILRMRRR